MRERISNALLLFLVSYSLAASILVVLYRNDYNVCLGVVNEYIFQPRIYKGEGYEE